MIQKKGRKWALYTSDGSRVLGTHSSYEAALAQERAIQVNKRIRSRHNPSNETEEFAPKVKLSSLGLSLPRPLRVFHAGLNSKLICEHGFKFRKELNTSGAGGGPDDAISFTGDARVAEAVCVVLGTLIRLFNRNLHPRELLEEMRIACPKALSQKLSSLSKELQDYFVEDCNNDFCSDEFITNFVDFYRDILLFAQFNKEAYDPYIASVDEEQYRSGGLDQIINVGYVVSYIPSESIIFPASGDLSQFGKDFFSYSRRGETTSLSEQNIKRGRVAKSGYYLLKEQNLSTAAKSIIEIASPYTPEIVDLNSLQPVSYLDSMNEYRVWSKESINNNPHFFRTQVVRYVLEMYDDTLPVLWGTDRVKSFYPYFEQKTLLENLSQYNPTNGFFN